MYKRILCALCIVIALFFIIPIFYLIWAREPSKQELVVKGPYLAIFLRNDYRNVNTSILLHDTHNSELILDGDSLWGTPLYQAGQTRYKKSLRFECHSNVPVKWEYQGDGGLVTEARHHNKREIKEIEDPLTYWFETVLEFFNVTEQITGKYVCRALDHPEPNIYVYVYGKGDRVFISKHETEEEVEQDRIITIPCPVSDPLRNISLKEAVLVGDEIIRREVDPSNIISYSAQIGFTIRPNNWNSYICLDEETGQSSGRVKIYKPRRNIVVGDFLTISSTNVAQNDSSLKVLCEATENITLNFINMAKFKRRQVYFVNDTSSFKFTSRIKLRTEYFMNHSAVECLTTKDQRVLRIWRFVDDESEWSHRTFLRFDNTSKGYECCTFTGQIPRLVQATCYSPTECEMKKSCVKLDNNKCPQSQIIDQPIYEGNRGCALAKIENHQSGILECSYGDNNKNYMYFYNKLTRFHNFTSKDFRKKNVFEKDILRLSQRQVLQKSVSPNATITFDCYGAKFFLESGFQWAFKKFGASVQYLINQSEPDEESLEELHESISIPLKNLTGGSTIICIAPILNSPQRWVNVTLKFKHI